MTAKQFSSFTSCLSVIFNSCIFPEALTTVGTANIFPVSVIEVVIISG